MNSLKENVVRRGGDASCRLIVISQAGKTIKKEILGLVFFLKDGKI